MSLNEVRLDRIIEAAALERAGDRDFPILSMTMHDGLVNQAAKFKKRIASASTADYKVVGKNQLVVGFPIDEGVLSFQSLYDEAVVSPAYDIWNLRSEFEVSPAYLQRFLRSPRALAFYRTKLRGTTARRRTLPDDIFLNLMVPLPPFPEQRRIAEILDKADALRAKRRATLAQLDTLTHSIFLDMFGDSKNFKSIPLESLAADKPYALSSGPFGSNLTSSHYISEGVLVLRGLNVTGGEIALRDCKFVSEAKAHELSRSVVIPGDVVIIAVGSSGQACLLPEGFPRAVMSQNFNKISPDTRVVDPFYLTFVLNGSFVQSQLIQRITDTVRTFLSLTKLKRVAIPLAPLQLQRKFTHRANSVQRLRAVQRAALSELNALMSSLQDRAFRGDL